MALEVKAPSSVLIDGRKLAFDEVSPPQPRGTILLLTGLGSKRLGWSRQIDVFGRSYRTIALDHRETGDSDQVTAAYTIADLADDAAAVLRALGIQRADVVGISLGGFVALNLAVSHPDLVDKLVLTSTSAGGSTHVPASQEVLALLMPDPGQEVGARLRATYSQIMAPDFVAAHPEELDRIAEVARYRPMAPEAYMRQLQAVVGNDVAQQLERIQAPTLVIHGEADPLVPPANGRYLAEHIKGARLITYPGVGHVPIVECPERYNRDVLAFLDEGRGEATASRPARGWGAWWRRRRT